MILKEDYVAPPEELDALDISNIINQMRSCERFKIEEFMYVEIGTRLVDLATGQIPGTIELCAGDDVDPYSPDWDLILMPGRHTNPPQWYPFRFYGNLSKCLNDLFYLRMAV